MPQEVKTRTGASGFFREGLRELARKWDRYKLRGQLHQQEQQRSQTFQSLGQQAWEQKLDLSAFPDLAAQLAQLEGRTGELSATTKGLEAERVALEDRRRAEGARFDAQHREVEAKKQPVDDALRTAAAQQRDLEQKIKTLEARASTLATELAKPAPERPAAQAQQLQAEQSRGSTELQAARAALPAQVAETGRLTEESQRFAAELAQIQAARKAALAEIDSALARLRSQLSATAREVGDVRRQSGQRFTELGQKLYEQKVTVPALTETLGQLAALDDARAATQSTFDASLAQSRTMPRGTMLKFSAAVLLVPGVMFALGAGIYSGLNKPQLSGEESRLEFSPEENVVADPGGPYEVERAGVVKLDGSRSKGPISSYEWTFSSSDAEKQGRSVQVKVLDDLEVTLTVRGGSKSDSKSTKIKVKPRAEWETEFQHVGQDYFSGSTLTADGLHLQFGRNTCAVGVKHWDEKPGDYLHRDHQKGEWEDTGYKLAQVKDPGGPFNSWWYVSENYLKIERKSWINGDLRPGSPTDKVNERAARATGKKESDFSVLRKQVHAHERMHSTLLEEILRGEDFEPAKKIEPLYDQEKESLKEQVEFQIRAAETQLLEATSDRNVAQRLKEKYPEFNRSGTVLLPVSGTSDYESYPIANFAELGDSAAGGGG